MHIQLTNFLRKKKILFSYQFDVWNSYWTYHALISLTEIIGNTLDNGSFACCILIDMQKAFDNQSWHPSFQTKSFWHQRCKFLVSSKAISRTELSILPSIIKVLKSKSLNTVWHTTRPGIKLSNSGS